MGEELEDFGGRLMDDADDELAAVGEAFEDFADWGGREGGREGGEEGGNIT